MAEQLNVTNDTGDHRYEARLDEDLAGYAEYSISDGVIDFNHTKVLDEFEGRGVASGLIKAALDDVAERGEYKVKASCSFVKSYIEKHPEYQDLLAK